jgi:glycosyltransferase involved in cell wall biosynthesis
VSESSISEDDFRGRLDEAERLRRAGRFVDAEQVYLTLLALRPAAPRVLCGLGESRYELGDLSGARDRFERALAASPEMSRALIGLARISEKLGDLQNALALFQRAHAAAPDVPWLGDRIHRIAQELAGGGRSAGATTAQPRFKHRFDFANDLLDKRNLADAEKIFRELLNEDQDSAILLCKLGRIAGELGRADEAMSYLDRAIAANPDYLFSYNRQSEILEAAGDIDAAVRVLETALQRNPAMAGTRDRIQSLRRKQELERERLRGVQVRQLSIAANSPARPAGGSPRTRVNVIAWDLTHNPVGRAMILADLAAANADCEIVGPMFAAHGRELWPPLQGVVHTVGIRGFEADSFASFMEGATRLVIEKPCDVAWVSKARLPSLLIGYLYKLIHGSSVLLDIDDDELAIVRGETPLTLDEFLAEHSPSDWTEPYSRRWTQLAASLIGFADGVTVCNPVLQERFGGILIRHARDPRPFEAARPMRDKIRSEFGFRPSDKVVLFLGTPRRHKGVLDVARALRRLADPDVVFCVIGTLLDKNLRKELDDIYGVRIVFFPDQPYSRLAELNAMADLVCMLQDPTDPIALAQTPAKLTDALASGTTILATAVAPILDVIGDGRVTAVTDETLTDELRRALSAGCADNAAADGRRALFRSEFSTDVNAVRAFEAINLARQRNAPIPDEIRRLFRHIDEFMPGALPAECSALTKGVFHTGPRVGRLKSLHDGVNLVFFWKQNDSSIFGRRQDMLLKQFAAQPNIAKILHVDAPISADHLASLANAGSSASPGLGRLVASNTVNRILGTIDDERIHRRTFVYRGRETHLLGRELPDIDTFPNAVEAWLRELDMTDNVLAWVCPVVPHFPRVQKRLGFSFIAADVIDDQRQWPMHPDWRAQIERNYQETFACTDVAFANCEPVARWLAEQGLDPLVVPNGMDIRTDVERWEVPAALLNLPRPIVGYSGNLAHRIDWELIDELSAARPGWSFVLIGEPARDGRCQQTLARDNVHALGVLPYETALRHIAAFDAAMIPHTRSGLSEHMNPLKLYVYRGLGIPVVSTAIANLDDFVGDVRVAESPAGFVSSLEAALAERRINGRQFLPADRMTSYSWESRAAQILARLGTAFEAGDQASEGIAA